MMAAAFLLLNLEQENDRALRRARVFRPRLRLLDDMDDIDLIAKYRLPPHLIVTLFNSLSDKLIRETSRSGALGVETQVLVALRYYASGCFYVDTGVAHGISKSSVSRALHQVTDSLCEHVQQYISFSTEDESLRIRKEKFFEFSNFPNVIGLVDGTQVPIKGPIVDEHLYVCRKGYHSVNMQIVCGPSLDILDIVSKWPGSAHDSFVWANCTLKEHLANTETNGFILGDSGYALQSNLLPPVLNPNTRPQQRYNTSHRRNRCTVERCIGVWKSRFRCLHRSGGCMQFSPQFCCKIIIATGILHSLCIKNAVPEPINLEQVAGLENNDDNEAEQDQGVQGQRDQPDGRRVRDELIQIRFSY